MPVKHTISADSRFGQWLEARHLISVLALVVMLGASTSPGEATAQELFLLCGAGLRPPVDELVSRFTEETAVAVKTEYGGSGKLLARLKATGRGDVYLPGSQFYVDRLKDRDEIISAHPVVLHTPVVAVWKGASQAIERFVDLAGPGVRIGLGDPQAMALGRTAEEILRKSGLGKRIEPNVVVRAATVKQLTLYIARGDVDAGIIGRADAVQRSESMRMIDIDRAWYSPEVITAAVLRISSHPDEARKLARFLSGPVGVETFVRYGFLPVESQ